MLTMPLPSPDNCHWCGFSLLRGEHGVVGPSEIEGNVSVKCLVPFDVTSDNVPRFDVLHGTGVMQFKSDGPA